MISSLGSPPFPLYSIDRIESELVITEIVFWIFFTLLKAQARGDEAWIAVTISAFLILINCSYLSFKSYMHGPYNLPTID